VPIIKSAKKKMKQDLKRRERNKALKSFMKNLKKKTLSTLETENAKKEDIVKALDYYKSQLDKAWAKGIFKRNKSSRLKSRIDLLFTKKFPAENK
jgi:small subunit ribosomal protein S20